MTARRLFAFVLMAVILAVPAHAASKVQRVVSPGGIEAWLIEDHSVPVIALNLALRGGAELDPVGQEGLARMTMGLLDEGAGDLDSEAFHARVENLAISLSFSAGLDTLNGSMKTLTEQRDTAFSLLGLALTKPRFDPPAVERVRDQILASLARDAEDPGTIAQRRWFAAAFPDHPYGRGSRGKPETVKAITIDDLKRFVGARFSRDRLIIAVAGDINARDLAPLLDRTFGGLPKDGGGPQLVADAHPTTGRVVVVEKDVPQSMIVFGEAGISREDPDFYAAFVVNHVLGAGGFSARLTKEVRVARGLAYGIGTSLLDLRHAPIWLGSTATRNDATSKTIDVIREVWGKLAREGVSAAELEDAKTYLTGSFPLQFTSTDSLADILLTMQVDNLGIDYLDRRNDYINKVTLDQANAVAKRLLDPDALSWSVVGEPQGVTPTKPPAAGTL